MAPATSSTAGIPMPECERQIGPMRAWYTMSAPAMPDDPVDVARRDPGVGDRAHPGCPR